MAIPGILGAKAGKEASKALTGDIYVRRWTTTPKKGKRKGMPVEHEVRVNAVTGAVVAVGAAATAVGGALALWMLQMRVKPTLQPGVRTVVDKPGYWTPEIGHWEDTGTGVNKGPLGWSLGARTWVVDTPSRWIPPETHEESTGTSVKRYSVEERKGFGIGEILQAPAEIAGAATRAPSVMWDVVWHPIKWLKR